LHFQYTSYRTRPLPDVCAHSLLHREFLILTQISSSLTLGYPQKSPSFEAAWHGKSRSHPDRIRQPFRGSEAVAGYDGLSHFLPIYLPNIKASGLTTSWPDVGRQVKAIRLSSRKSSVVAGENLTGNGNDAVEIGVPKTMSLPRFQFSPCPFRRNSQGAAGRKATHVPRENARCLKAFRRQRGCVAAACGSSLARMWGGIPQAKTKRRW
jgi:hypothetical protein